MLHQPADRGGGLYDSVKAAEVALALQRRRRVSRKAAVCQGLAARAAPRSAAAQVSVQGTACCTSSGKVCVGHLPAPVLILVPVGTSVGTVGTRLRSTYMKTWSTGQRTDLTRTLYCREGQHRKDCQA